ncbi:Homeodomain-like domain-containing protein [Pseudonocardia ammonioxydans]|uniref:Transcriptional regulator WhiB n=2 Tax=Pseudonocardia ammonioxydans TaxID=260086 RepID=A0A1I4XY52_PSUAM|nr:Homeodomain-like domain-containing protein [Pseudonocardia ammonioxydans]
MTTVRCDDARGDCGDWRSRAACRGSEPETFFPTAAGGPELARAEAAAKRICTGCPVRTECLAWAMEVLPFGIAGGLSEAERAERRRATRTPRRRGLGRGVAMAKAHRASPGRDAGLAALAAGGDRTQVAIDCGVSRRTVDRWAAALVAEAPAGGAR